MFSAELYSFTTVFLLQLLARRLFQTWKRKDFLVEALVTFNSIFTTDVGKHNHVLWRHNYSPWFYPFFLYLNVWHCLFLFLPPSQFNGGYQNQVAFSTLQSHEFWTLFPFILAWKTDISFLCPNPSSIILPYANPEVLLSVWISTHPVWSVFWWLLPSW